MHALKFLRNCVSEKKTSLTLLFFENHKLHTSDDGNNFPLCTVAVNLSVERITLPL